MQIFGADLSGIDGQQIKFGIVHASKGQGVGILGNAGKVVREGVQRAIEAISTLNGNWSKSVFEGSRYTFDLSPAAIEKVSEGLDLPIAIMLLQASIMQDSERLDERIESTKNEIASLSGKDRTRREVLMALLASLTEKRTLIAKYRERLASDSNDYLLIGKLDISDGTLSSPYYGMFGLMCAARPNQIMIIPEDAETHAALVAEKIRGLRVFKAKSLQEVWNIILGVARPRIAKYNPASVTEHKPISGHVPDFKDIRGVERLKRAMVVAVAGGHNILVVGPPGCGKTMTAKAALRLLPDLDSQGKFELNKIYSAKGLLGDREIIVSRPFQEVTNNVTVPALFGGTPVSAGGLCVPGIASLAHEGILFLDEINLCNSSVIEQLRIPLNDRRIRVSRLNKNVEYPSNFLLVAAMNPCKCGYFGHFKCGLCGDRFLGSSTQCPRHPNGKLLNVCSCTRSVIANYCGKISRPILDRIDIKVFVSPYSDPRGAERSLASSTILKQVQEARDIQFKRYGKHSFIRCNGNVPDRGQLENLSVDVNNFFQGCLRRLDLSKRQELKVLLVSRTIADLDKAREIERSHITEAIHLMGLNDPYFQQMGL